MTMVKTMKSYSEMMKLKTFQERVDYLYLGDMVAHETFGRLRYLNQRFYSSLLWRKTRDNVIIRDQGCDLGIEGLDIPSNRILIHHINPISIDDLINMSPCLTDPENLICLTQLTHNYIHYGSQDNSRMAYMVYGADRSPNDTCPWKKL